jgi:hypothetical protein
LEARIAEMGMASRPTVWAAGSILNFRRSWKFELLL